MENKIYTEKRQFLPISANLHRNLHKKRQILPIFGVKSVKIYTGQFFYKDTVCGVCDKYEVWQKCKGIKDNHEQLQPKMRIHEKYIYI